MNLGSMSVNVSASTGTGRSGSLGDRGRVGRGRRGDGGGGGDVGGAVVGGARAVGRQRLETLICHITYIYIVITYIYICI